MHVRAPADHAAALRRHGLVEGGLVQEVQERPHDADDHGDGDQGRPVLLPDALGT
jgi:hypothetical protein